MLKAYKLALSYRTTVGNIDLLSVLQMLVTGSDTGAWSKGPKALRP